MNIQTITAKSKIKLIGVGLLGLLLNWFIWFGGFSLLIHHNMLLTPIHSEKQLLISGLFSPIFEELLFRDGLLPFFIRWGHFKKKNALLLSSLFFAFLHGQPLFIGYFFIGGLIFGLIKLISHDYYSSIVLHLLFNILTLSFSIYF